MHLLMIVMKNNSKITGWCWFPIGNNKNKGVVSDEKYTEYATALSDWSKISSSILEEIKSGNQQQGVDDILNKCTPALNKLVNIAKELDEITDAVSAKAVQNTVVYAILGVGFIVFF